MKKAVLVTGGSRGIGAATARKLAEAGYAVCINYMRDARSAGEVVFGIARAGGTAIQIQADVSDEHAVARMFAEIDDKLGALYGLVNNAAIIGDQATLTDMSPDRIRRIFEVNVFGTFLCSKEAVKRMSAGLGGAGGAIVNISSGASISGSPNEYIDYAATKGAIDTFTRGLAREVAKNNIRVNAIRPGFIETEIHRIPGRLEAAKHQIPMGRVGQPEEIAGAVLWLLSDQASYTTGTIIDVAGGK
ncbi:MAG: SDR family oxidoreductase [Saprospiraceae bacterium]